MVPVRFLNAAAVLFAATLSIAGSFFSHDARAQGAHRGHTPGYSHLSIDGYALRWPTNGPGGRVSLTWSFAGGRYDSPKAVNCKSMSPMEPIARQVGHDTLRHETEAAFAAWQMATNITFRFSDDWKSADILIGSQTDPTGVAFANVDFAGEKGERQASIRKGLVCLNPLRLWKSRFDGNLEVLDLRYVLLLEIGHTLGLDHAGSRGQLMSFKYLEQFRDLQPGDVAGITALYGSKRLATR
jgi:hypothetical protein